MASTPKTVKAATSPPFKTDAISPQTGDWLQVTQRRSLTVTVISRSIAPVSSEAIEF
ncbi:hypothetical protein H6F67_24740 [Microcoleus sp. FACHB-1515]|uniref:hypothetical protein n=1 Tax=Cyanophyceae TaxID=3028117 RepID=UPI0016840FF6|nr:hypothetical protein [Microcoleus sp. FACHB-1515]MBD2093060.1 hypothetical protein [Microcoleus sp. FACHB-1515]